LAFYRDAELLYPIAMYKGAAHTFVPVTVFIIIFGDLVALIDRSNVEQFVVDADKFWYRFASGPGSTHWGIRQNRISSL
jgi:hypothetical protein